MIAWLKTYAHTHIFYIILIVISVLSFRVWLQEHDARVTADNVAKQQEVLVADLKKQIEVTQTQAVQEVEVVKQVVAKAKTPSDVVAILPKLTSLPLNTQPVPQDYLKLEVDALPLLQLAGDDKTANTELVACQQVSVLKDQQLTAKDTEIASLKKKPKFFKRMGGALKAVGVGVGIGVLLASHL
jgi:hypothetical protein